MNPFKSKSCVLLTFGGLFLLLLAVGLAFILRGVRRVQVAANLPPTVLVLSPTNGETFPEGNIIPVHVNATAQNPIARLEFWLDGALVDTKTPDPTSTDPTVFSTSSQVQITLGAHTLSVRAVDSGGLIGQSPPLALLGVARVAQEGEGETNETGSAQPPEGGTPSQPPAGGAPTQPPVQPPATIITPAPLPVTPPGAAAPSLITVQPIDLGSIWPIILAGRPKAPSALQVGYENCTIRLLWMDNATNETHFNIWMQPFGGTAQVIATLKGTGQATGPTWYEFASPWAGIYSFWVEAVNALGSQSSEIAWGAVPDVNCGPGVATHLSIRVLDLFVVGGYDRAYCYLSIEGVPEKRVPRNDGEFVRVSGGWGDVSHLDSLLHPIPPDGEITLEGKCLGWSGNSGPDDLGTFSAHAPKETWDGRRQELRGAGFVIGYRIEPYGPSTASGFFGYTDYSLPAPSQPSITIQRTSNASENERLARRPTLHWRWGGDPQKLTGFTIFLDGQFFRHVPNWQGGKPGEWEEMFLLPTSCGGVYNFQVAANVGSAQSPLSPSFTYRQLPCETYIKVTYETVEFTAIDDGEIGSNDDAEVYYQLRARVSGGEDKVMTFYSWDAPRTMVQHKEYTFYDLGLGNTRRTKNESMDTIIIPLSSEATPKLTIMVDFYDYDALSLDDWLCLIDKDIRMPASQWKNYSSRYTTSCREGLLIGDAEGMVTYRVETFQGPPV
ncbi:MAG: hypothetical protein D6770_01070, partial [Anaerolineae bacterium]